MSESLKSNTTLTELKLCSEDMKEDTQKTSINKSPISFLFSTTGNGIGNTEATSLSEALKSNTTLTEIYLSGEDKRHTKGIHQQFTLPILFIPTDNSIRERGATSLSESLKSNTILTELDLSSEDKRRHTKEIHQQFTLSLSHNRKQYW